MSKWLFEHVKLTCRHLLSEINRDSTSVTYGCFDRRFWAWKLTDFPEATFQRNVAGLAWLHRQINSKPSQKMICEAIKAGLCFAGKIQHRDGSFDQAYPHEHSYGATGFLLPDLITAYEIIILDCTISEKQSIESCLRKAAKFLSAHHEQHGLISNHLAGAALGLLKAGFYFDEEFFKIKSRNLIETIIANQSPEGWFPEYGGADPGYQTLCMHYLAQIYQLEPTKDLRTALEKSLDFLKYFAHPDGSFGGEYGSRRTEIFYPGGIALLADEFQDAAYLCEFMINSSEAGNTINLSDIDMGNTAPLLNSYILALETGKNSKELLSKLPFNEVNLNKDFHAAGLAIRSREKYFLIFGASNGGVLKIFDKNTNRLILDDCGIIGSRNKGSRITTQSTCLENPMKTGRDFLESESRFFNLKDSIPNPFNFFLLRFLNLTFMRVEFFNEKIKKMLVKLLIQNNSRIEMFRKRTIKLKNNSVEISDTITNQKKIRLNHFRQGFKFNAIHMASTRYFSNTQFVSPEAQPLDQNILSDAGFLKVMNEIMFEDSKSQDQ